MSWSNRSNLIRDYIPLNMYSLQWRDGAFASGGSENFSLIPLYTLPVFKSCAKAPDSPKFGFSGSGGAAAVDVVARAGGNGGGVGFRGIGGALAGDLGGDTSIA